MVALCSEESFFILRYNAEYDGEPDEVIFLLYNCKLDIIFKGWLRKRLWRRRRDKWNCQNWCLGGRLLHFHKFIEQTKLLCWWRDCYSCSLGTSTLLTWISARRFVLDIFEKSVFIESSNIRNLFWTFSKSRLPCWQRIEYCFVFDWIVSFTISNSCYERRLWYSQWGPSSNSERVTRSSCPLFGKTRIQETGLGRDHRSRTPIWSGPPGKITKRLKIYE